MEDQASSLVDDIRAEMGSEEQPVEELEVEQVAQSEETPEEVQEEATEAVEEPWELDITWNGQERKLTREEARSLAQKGYDADHKWQEAAEMRRYAEQVAQNAMAVQQMDAEVMNAYAEAKAMERQLEAYKNVDWAALIEQDGVTFQKVKLQHDMLKESYGEAIQKFNGLQQQVTQKRGEMQQHNLQSEVNALLGKLPEWKNPEVRVKEDTAIRSWLSKQGYRDEEINALSDHRALLVARKAWLYDQANPAGKRLANLPPVVKPGTAQTKAEIKQGKDMDFKKQMKSAKDSHTKAELIKQRLMQRI